MKYKIYNFYKRHIRTIPDVKSYALASIFVFILGLVITLLSWYVDKQRVENQYQAEIVAQATALENDINRRLSIYEQMIRGTSGLFGASDKVSQEEWAKYIKRYDLANTYPGVTTIGYVEYVNAANLSDFLSRLAVQGLPSAIFPVGDRPEYAPITYIDPFNDVTKRAIGYDTLADPSRAHSIEQARDNGRVTISEKLTLINDRDTANQSSFAMFTAIYKDNIVPDSLDERKENFKGVVYAGFRSQDFFDEAIDRSKFHAYSAVEIFDGESTDQKSLLYASSNLASVDKSQQSQAFTMNSFERPWTFRFAGPLSVNKQDTQRSNMILIGGTTISFAIAGFLFLVMLTRARDIAYAKQREAQQAKDDLLSLASHQLRTPATAVKQYLGMILEGYTGPVDEKQLPALQKAYASNERQLDTINQILYVAKADAGRLSINKMPFDLNLLIDDIALDLEDTLESKGQSIIIEPSVKRLQIDGDEASLRMVIENLITNASKYSYDDSHITIKTGIKDNQAYVSVIDQGVGIAPEDFVKLFKKFSRIDNDLSLQVGGSGIGLYIDKVLIELHGGLIEVSSTLGEGSVFTIWLPLRSANNLTDGEQTDESL